MSKPKSESKNYFTEETEQAIIEFNKSTDPDERDRIFNEKIHYPLDKLAENIINRFKFSYIASFEETKQQVVSFLVTNISKFTEGRGKAFSYFSVIAKNYLILHNKNGYKYEKEAVYLSDIVDGTADVSVPNVELLSLNENIDAEELEDYREFMKLILDFWDKNLKRIFKKKRDRDIADAILELLRRSDTIENYNKKSLYLMIREMTNCNTVSIIKVIKKMRVYMNKHWLEYQKHGIINVQGRTFFSL